MVEDLIILIQWSRIGGININDIERIEITKGSGSVIYGDSAMAGAIHYLYKKEFDTKISTLLEIMV